MKRQLSKGWGMRISLRLLKLFFPSTAVSLSSPHADYKKRLLNNIVATGSGAHAPDDQGEVGFDAAPSWVSTKEEFSMMMARIEKLKAANPSPTIKYH